MSTLAAKLIRSRMPRPAPENTKQQVIHNPALLAGLLIGKLHEEAEEVRTAKTVAEFKDEMGDCLQVLYDRARLEGVPWEEIERAAEDKFERKGGFLDGTMCGTLHTRGDT